MGKKSLALATGIHYETGMALGYLTMGVAYSSKGQYPEAMKCDLEALKISEKLGMEGLTGNNYGNIGNLYTVMGDYPKALQYLNRALQIAERNKEDTVRRGVADMLINMGEIFKKNNQFDSAIAYNSRARQIGEKAHDSMVLSITLFNIGENYIKKEQPGKALGYLQPALRISEALHDDEGIAWAYNSIAEAYHQQNLYGPSLRYAEMSLNKAEALHITEIISESCHTLYVDHRDLQDFKSALYYRNREIALHDSMVTLEKEKQIKGLQSDYQLEQQQHQIELLNKDRLLQQEELARGKIKYYVFIVGTILLGLWAFILARANAQKKRLNRLLENRNQKIGKQNKQLEDLNAVKNKLLSIIGHDLRSPMATLKGFVDLMKNSALSQAQIHFFSMKMSESLEATSHLLDNLLFWAKSQMEGMQANIKAFDLRSLISQNQRLVQSRADEKKIMLLTDETASPLMVCADEIMIDLVIRNLVENAIKFSRADDTVSILAVGGNEIVTVTIADTGQGIPAESQDKIFNRAVSFTTAGTSREKGSGLGLSLCKELVERNGGKIWFESAAGKGTSFIFTIPVSSSL